MLTSTILAWVFLLSPTASAGEQSQELQGIRGPKVGTIRYGLIKVTNDALLFTTNNGETPSERPKDLSQSWSLTEVKKK